MPVGTRRAWSACLGGLRLRCKRVCKPQHGWAHGVLWGQGQELRANSSLRAWGSASFMQDRKMKLCPKAKTSAASMDPNAANRSNGNVGYSSSCPASPPTARKPHVLKTDSTLAVVLTKRTGADCLRIYGGGHTHGQRHWGWCICQIREHPLAVAIKAACVWPQKLTRLTASWHFLKMLIVLHHTKAVSEIQRWPSQPFYMSHSCLWKMLGWNCLLWKWKCRK